MEPIRVEDLIERLDSLLEGVEDHPDQQVRERVAQLLHDLQSLHRAALERLTGLIRESGHERLLEELAEDELIGPLFVLYDLHPQGAVAQVEAALESVRPYIASHGGAVEVLGVEDGIVHLRMSGSCHGCPGSAITLKRGIEEALRQGFPGFRGIEVVEAPQPEAGPTNTAVSEEDEGSPRPLKPVWVPIGRVEEIEDGVMRGLEVEGIRLLLSKLEGEIYACRNACPGTVLPLEFGEVEGIVLTCPWHGCRYDLRSGKRLDRDGGHLDVFPVAVREGEIQLALNVPGSGPLAGPGTDQEGSAGDG